MKRIGWALLIGLMLSLPVQAASFDCTKAGTDVEKLICADKELSKLDEDLTIRYQQALKRSGNKQLTSKEQRRWLKEVRNTCRVTTCLQVAYQTRIQELAVNWGEAEATLPFRLVKGNGIEVCEIYKKNLDALSHSDLSCERRVSPEYQDIIKLPEWRKLDLWEYRNLWAQAEKMGNGGINRPGWMESKNTPMDNQSTIDDLAERYHADIQRYNREVYKLYIADVDMDNDGKNEEVLRAHSGLCGEPVHYKSIALFVLTDKGDAVDLQKSRSLFQDAWHNPWTKKFEQSGTFSNGSMYDLFLYKNIAYFDKWSRYGIRIYKKSDDETKEICRLN